MFRKTFSTRGWLLLTGVVVLWTAGSGSAQSRPGSFQPAQPPYHHTYSNYGWTHYYNYYPHYGEYRYNYYPYYSYNYGYPLNPPYGYSGSDAYVQPGDVDRPTARSRPSRDYPLAYPPPAYTPSNAEAQPDRTATITVRVPANAQVWIDEAKTTTTGSVREYQTPPLTPGSRYSYQVRARWEENGREVTQTQKVSFTAGAHVRVSFPAPSGTEGKAETPKTR